MVLKIPAVQGLFKIQRAPILTSPERASLGVEQTADYYAGSGSIGASSSGSFNIGTGNVGEYWIPGLVVVSCDNFTDINMVSMDDGTTSWFVSYFQGNIIIPLGELGSRAIPEGETWYITITNNGGASQTFKVSQHSTRVKIK